MKLTYFIQQKTKVSILLYGVMVVILFTNILAQKNIERFNKNFQSIYNDRLIPVKDIFYISENVHAKTHLLEKYFANGTDCSTLKLLKELDHRDKEIDSLLKKYEKTYLEEEERAALASLKLRLKDFEKIEKTIVNHVVNGSKEEGRTVFEAHGKLVIESTHAELQTIANLQTIIGNSLMEDTKFNALSSIFLLTVQIVVALLIGLFICSLILSAKVINRKNEKFNLN